MIRIDVLDHDGDSVSSVTRQEPVVVGSGEGCDVRLSDPSVSERHVVFTREPDGQIRVRDLGSESGTRAGILAVEDATVSSGARIEVGTLVLRVSVAEEAGDAPPVGATAATDSAENSGAAGPGTRRLSLSTAWFLFAAVLILSAVQQYLDAFTNEPLRDVALMVVGVLALVLVWAGFWALGNRIFRSGFNFATHLGMFSLWMLIMTPVWWFTGTLQQVVHVDATRSLSMAVGVASAAALLFLHIRVASRWTDRTNGLVAVALVLGIGGLALLADDSGAAAPMEKALTPIAALPAWVYVTTPVEALPERTEEIMEELEDLEARRTAGPGVPGS